MDENRIASTVLHGRVEGTPKTPKNNVVRINTESV